MARVDAIEAQLAAELAPAADLPAVADVRVLGAIGVVELHRPLDAAAVSAACVDLGVWLRPFGRNLYTMPPYVAEPADIAKIAGAMRWIFYTAELGEILFSRIDDFFLYFLIFTGKFLKLYVFNSPGRIVEHVSM